ncbi:MAG TPA: sigma-70 family RNA polymerase sigma factor [Bryobacteraceae bacterium]|nr:sigma-70 family RNA polymerase sigma factor [Bryobacteraceae bacterium]
MSCLPISPDSIPREQSSPSLYYRVCRVGGNLERQVFDQEYISRLTRGDAETERHFSRYFGDLLLIKLRARVRSPQLVEDARQETFLRVLNVLRNKGGIQHPERLGAFVNSVCENVLLELFRSAGRFQQMAENAPEPVDESASADSDFVTFERKAVVRQVLDKLADTDRQILRMLFLEERDKDEICRHLHIDRDYLRVRLHRALARCRTAIQKTKEPAPVENVAGG